MCRAPRAPVDQAQLFAPLFARAERLAAGEAWTAAALRGFVDETLRGYLGEVPVRGTGEYGPSP